MSHSRWMSHRLVGWCVPSWTPQPPPLYTFCVTFCAIYTFLHLIWPRVASWTTWTLANLQWNLMDNPVPRQFLTETWRVRLQLSSPCSIIVLRFIFETRSKYKSCECRQILHIPLQFYTPLHPNYLQDEFRWIFYPIAPSFVFHRLLLSTCIRKSCWAPVPNHRTTRFRNPPEFLSWRTSWCCLHLNVLSRRYSQRSWSPSHHFRYGRCLCRGYEICVGGILCGYGHI